MGQLHPKPPSKREVAASAVGGSGFANCLSGHGNPPLQIRCEGAVRIYRTACPVVTPYKATPSASRPPLHRGEVGAVIFACFRGKSPLTLIMHYALLIMNYPFPYTAKFTNPIASTTPVITTASISAVADLIICPTFRPTIPPHIPPIIIKIKATGGKSGI